MTDRKAYLGDAVYADFEHNEVVLTTENGIRATNRIVLEGEVVVSLLRWLVNVYGPEEIERFLLPTLPADPFKVLVWRTLGERIDALRKAGDVAAAGELEDCLRELGCPPSMSAILQARSDGDPT